MTEKQKIDFETVCKPVIEWMNKNCNPHCTVLIDTTSAELFEGKLGFYTEESLVD